MTLNLLVQLPEGLVLFADSMVSSSLKVDGKLERIHFKHARKLFHLGESCPAAAMINGDANVGQKLVGQLLREASRDIDKGGKRINHELCLGAFESRHNGRVQRAKSGITNQSGNERSSPKQSGAEQSDFPYLSVIVASFFDSARATLVSWPGSLRKELLAESDNGIWWWGSGIEVLYRLIVGYDVDRLAEAAKSNDDAKAALRYFKRNEAHYEMESALAIMPIQQAIYFAEYLARVSAGFDRFQVGPHTVGGEVDVIALVDGELKWIHKQSLKSSFDEWCK